MQSVLLPILSAKVCRKHMANLIDRNRVTDIEEISGNGVIAKVDGVSVAAGNAKLMNRLGIAYTGMPSRRNSGTHGCRWQICRTYPDL